MPNKKPVAPFIVKHYEFLSKLGRTRSLNKSLKLIDAADPEQLESIVEVADNLLALDRKTGKPVFHINKRQRAKLIPVAAIVRQISRARAAKNIKRKIQKGAGFAALAPLLIPVISEVARALFRSKKTDGS